MTELTCKDLMVGDYIKNDLGEIQRVVELRENGVMLSYNDCYSYDEIEPIELTPQILEKNGFKIAKGPTYENNKFPTYCWDCDGKRNFTNVTLSFYNKPVSGVTILTRIECDSYHENGVNMIHSCDIEYVHQLQHALNLLCIDKQIEL